MNNFLLILLAGAGGFIGTILRFAIGQWLFKFQHSDFPLATLLINIAGCLAIGIIYGISDRSSGIPYNARIFFTVGLCGGFTTFSAFAMENLQLLRDGRIATAIIYITLSIVLGIAAALGGNLLIKYSYS